LERSATCDSRGSHGRLVITFGANRDEIVLAGE
jgi:hypothetical protein